MADQADKLRELMASYPSKNQRMIAIASGKGGVGKTNLAVNLGIALSEMGQNVIVVDADLGLANINVLMGLTPKYNLFHVTKGIKSMRDVVISTPYNIRFVAGACGFSELANMKDSERKNLIRGIETLKDADIVIVDTGAGISKNVISFALSSDDVVIITTAEPTSITDAYGIIKSISMEQTKVNINLVVNRVKHSHEAKRVSDRIISISKEFLDLDINYLGFIFEDNSIPYSVVHQVPFYSYDNCSRASVCVSDLAKKILNVSSDEKKYYKGINGLIESFMNIYSNVND